MITNDTIKMRIYPDDEQQRKIDATLSHCRYMSNITKFKRTSSDVLNSEYKCYKFFFKVPPQKQGPKSIRYSEYKIYQSENYSALDSWYHFFVMNECPLKNLVYYLEYGDVLIEIQNDDELINDAWRGDSGWKSPKIKTGKIYELDSVVFRNLLENSIRQTVSLQLTERDIYDILNIIEKLILRLSIVNVFWLERFLNIEYNFEITHNYKVRIVKYCTMFLSLTRYNNCRKQAANIISQLEKWLME